MFDYKGYALRKEDEPVVPFDPGRCLTREQIARINATPPTERPDEQPKFAYIKQPDMRPNNYPPCKECGGPTGKYTRKNGKRLYRCKSEMCGCTTTEMPE